MNIIKQYAWQHAEDSRENSPLLPRNLRRGLVIGKSRCGKTTAIFSLLLQPGWTTITCAFLERVFINKNTRFLGIERFSGVCNGRIRADVYDNCQDIPDPSALDPKQKNLLLSDD